MQRNSFPVCVMLKLPNKSRATKGLNEVVRKMSILKASYPGI